MRVVLVAILFSLLTGPVRGEEPLRPPPAQILLIRHAEKPDDDESVDLSPRGRERASALGGLFSASPSRPEPFSTPAFVFATANSKHSHRPVETVTPYAVSFGHKIESTFADDQVDLLAGELQRNARYSGKVILVCWHHGKLPDLARALGATDAPDKWNGAVFDRVWQLTYDGSGKCSFLDRPQNLLPGDSPQ